jgi:hypothetical protein
MSFYNGIVEIYYKDSKLAFPEWKYEQKGFIRQFKELGWDYRSGSYSNPTDFVVCRAREQARGMKANAIVDATLETHPVDTIVFNDTTRKEEKVVRVVREFSGIAVWFEKN